MIALVNMANIEKDTPIPEIIKFIKQKDFKFKKKLGNGACGQTILIVDETIGEEFVCKKYLPISEVYRVELYKRFIDEIKILYRLNHENVVRIFNYYLYPTLYSGYIIMEYIEGCSIDLFIEKHPDKINDIFEQIVRGFAYLCENKVLHRDIRNSNIMVTKNGVAKIIDFGFSKEIVSTSNAEKSLSLAWWCTLPDEFRNNTYDFRTEVYFLGKLFEQLISDNNIDEFKYKSILKMMLYQDPSLRVDSFLKINNLILSNQFAEMNFSEEEKIIYRYFSCSLKTAISSIRSDSTYENDTEKLIRSLDDTYRKNMLEECVQNDSSVISAFIKGTYSYWKNKQNFEVDKLLSFLEWFKNSNKEKRTIILSNMYSKLDTVPRSRHEIVNDDVPF